LKNSCKPRILSIMLFLTVLIFPVGKQMNAGGARDAKTKFKVIMLYLALRLLRLSV